MAIADVAYEATPGGTPSVVRHDDWFFSKWPHGASAGQDPAPGWSSAKWFADRWAGVVIKTRDCRTVARPGSSRSERQS